MTGTAGEITALLNLIEDPDENVYQTVKSRIIEIGNGIIPALEAIKEMEETPLQTERINEIIAAILLEKLQNSIEIWENSDEKSFLEIAFHIHEYICPNAQKADFLFEIDSWSTPNRAVFTASILMTPFLSASGDVTK
jgi:hypothetical protein